MNVHLEPYSSTEEIYESENFSNNTNETCMCNKAKEEIALMLQYSFHDHDECVHHHILFIHNNQTHVKVFKSEIKSYTIFMGQDTANASEI